MANDTVSPATTPEAEQVEQVLMDFLNLSDGRGRKQAAQRVLDVMRAAVAAAARPAPQPPAMQPLEWPSCGDKLYGVLPQAGEMDVHDHLSARLTHLTAMLTAITCFGFETFNGHSNTTKDNYLWACAMMSKECEQLSDALYTRRAAGRRAAEVPA